MKHSEASGWPERWTEVIGDAVRVTRTRRKFSAQELSARTSDLGYEIPRNTITNLENHRKRTIGVHEVAILALALGVSPLGLLFPPDVADELPIPGLTALSTIDVARWWAGPMAATLPDEPLGLLVLLEEARTMRALAQQRVEDQVAQVEARRAGLEAAIAAGPEIVGGPSEKDILERLATAESMVAFYDRENARAEQSLQDAVQRFNDSRASAAALLLAAAASKGAR